MIWVLLLFYLAGTFGSLWKRATLSADSLHTPWYTVRQYCQYHLGDILYTQSIALGLFGAVWHNTQFLTTMLAWLGFTKDIEIPLNTFTAAIYGAFSESVVDLIVAKLRKLLGPTPASKP